MIEFTEKVVNWTIDHNADYKALIVIALIVVVVLFIDFYKKVIKGK